MTNYKDYNPQKQKLEALEEKELQHRIIASIVSDPKTLGTWLVKIPSEIFTSYKALFIKLQEAFKREGLKGLQNVLDELDFNTRNELMSQPIEYYLDEWNLQIFVNEMKKRAEKNHIKYLLDDIVNDNLTTEDVIQELMKMKSTFEGSTAKLSLKDMEEEILMNDIKPLFTLPLFNLPVYPGDIILISARTGDGKTTVALNLIMQLIKSEETVDVNSNQESFDRKALYFTYEIPVSMLVKSFAANDLEKPMNDITKDDMKAFIDKYGGNLGIHEGTKFEDVLSYVWLFHPDVFVIDYDQLVLTKGKFESEERRLAYIVRSLKDVAVATQSACILISQINEDGKVRYSREKEHAASIYIHIERPRDKDGDVVDPNTITYKVKKNRYGVTGTSGVLKVNWETRKVEKDNTPTFRGA